MGSWAVTARGPQFRKQRRPYGPGWLPGGQGIGPTQPPIVMVVSSKARRATRSLIEASQDQVATLRMSIHTETTAKVNA